MANSFLHSLDDDFLDCRTMGHSCEEVGNHMNGKEVTFVVQCTRCDSYFVIEWEKTGGRINRRPYYTPGYLSTEGRVDRNEARAERIRRTKFSTTKQFESLMARIDEERERYR